MDAETDRDALLATLPAADAFFLLVEGVANMRRTRKNDEENVGKRLAHVVADTAAFGVAFCTISASMLSL